MVSLFCKISTSLIPVLTSTGLAKNVDGEMTILMLKTITPDLMVLNVLTSNDFVTLKIAVASNCNRTVTKKNGNELKVFSSLACNGSKVTPLLFKSNLPTTAYGIAAMWAMHYIQFC